MDLRLEYERLRPSLDEAARGIEVFLRLHLPSSVTVDRITSRAKSTDRFLAKAQKQENGAAKYANPVLDIQDLLGARIVVLYLHEVEELKRFFPNLLRVIEMRRLEPEGFSEFGYIGWHALVFVPEEAVPSGAPDNFPKFFELQVKTIFQHAWAEAQHDLEYKEFRGSLTREDKRLIAFAAAQAWGADNSFEAVLQEMARRKTEVPDEIS